MSMTPEARRELSTTIRTLRANLLSQLHDATESAYRLSVRTRDAGLGNDARERRRRFEDWIRQRERETAGTGSPKKSGVRDFRREAESQAAYTLLNRLVILRLFEASGTGVAPLSKPAVITGGAASRALADLRKLAPDLCRHDDTEGAAFLLRLVFEELALDLPGIFGPSGVAELVPVPAATLRLVVDSLDALELKSCWTDELTLGWVYQYWNDPERERLDEKINGGGKIEPHEIASKTQLFTERYMVDWLLQNTLGPLWFSICAKHGWTPVVQADGTLDRLEARRRDWRERREANEVSPAALMPLEDDAERRWSYFVPRPGQAPAPTDLVSLRDVKILDPACGSGHFLVVALALLIPLLREEAAHRGLENDPAWSEQALVEHALENCLHGLDIDPRAVQIAAAALWISARRIAPDARPRRLSLVASNLELARLSDEDPALVALRTAIERETGIPPTLTDTILHALKGADHLGSLLRVGREVEAALAQHEADLGKLVHEQGNLFSGFAAAKRRPVALADARETLLDLLESFLAHHTGDADLGLRLHGEQLAAGVRFVRLLREGTYDLVVANPPYQGTSKMADSKYVDTHYPLGKADLFAAFLLRGLELVKDGGLSAMLTMRSWMFIKQYAGLRKELLSKHDLLALGDFEVGAFGEIGGFVVSVNASIFQRSSQVHGKSVALQLTLEQAGSAPDRTACKRAATLCHVGRHEFDPAALKVVPEWPLVYWWDIKLINMFNAQLLGEFSPARQGLATMNNDRFIRRSWEIFRLFFRRNNSLAIWAPFIKGSNGKSWSESIEYCIKWPHSGLELKNLIELVYGSYTKRIANEKFYFEKAISFSTIGNQFSARKVLYPSIFDVRGSCVFAENISNLLCMLNSSFSKKILESLNPGINFQVGDVNRLPLFPIENADDIFAIIEEAFSEHEAHREPSVEFKRPGPSHWRAAQAWAQTAVDRPAGAPLPEYVPEHDPESPTDWVSYAMGVGLGRFGADGEGLLDTETADLSRAFPAGICFLDNSLREGDWSDSLGHFGAVYLWEMWAATGRHFSKKSLRAWLSWDFFKDVQKGMYENRPIHWPLSSADRTFVAWVNIHRMNDRTLMVLLADHLAPARTRIDGELADLLASHHEAGGRGGKGTDRRIEELKKARQELAEFIRAIEDLARLGPPPTDPKCPPREVDAAFSPVLDDGVMINAASLWPVLEPQWKEPKKWWKELATSQGKKDYDWSSLARRHFPSRVDAKCQVDPSLAVAHGCFWRYHPARAYAWELRLQDEIGPDFLIEEAPYAFAGDDPGSAGHRAAWLAAHNDEARAAVEKETARRTRKSRKGPAELDLLDEVDATDDEPSDISEEEES